LEWSTESRSYTLTERKFACIQQIGPWSMMSEVWEGEQMAKASSKGHITGIDRTAVSVCWAGFSRAVIASHASLFPVCLDITLCLPSTLAHIWSVHLLLQLYINCLIYLNYLYVYSVGDSLYSIGRGIPNGCGSKVID